MSKEMEEILEECLRRLKEGDGIESCLSHYPEKAEELRPLLYAAIRAREAFSRIQPHPYFKAKLKYRLLSLSQRRAYWQQRWAFALLSVLVLFLLGGGAVWASSGSLPDQPLYPVKLATEKVQLFLSPSPHAKASLQARLIEKRMEEMERMIARETPAMKHKYIEITEERIIGHLKRIHNLAPQLKKEEKAKLREFLIEKRAQHQRIMAEMLPSPLPPSPLMPEIRPIPPHYERAIEILKE